MLSKLFMIIRLLVMTLLLLVLMQPFVDIERYAVNMIYAMIFIVIFEKERCLLLCIATSICMCIAFLLYPYIELYYPEYLHESALISNEGSYQSFLICSSMFFICSLIVLAISQMFKAYESGAATLQPRYQLVKPCSQKTLHDIQQLPPPRRPRFLFAASDTSIRELCRASVLHLKEMMLHRRRRYYSILSALVLFLVLWFTLPLSLVDNAEFNYKRDLHRVQGMAESPSNIPSMPELYALHRHSNHVLMRLVHREISAEQAIDQLAIRPIIEEQKQMLNGIHQSLSFKLKDGEEVLCFFCKETTFSHLLIYFTSRTDRNGRTTIQRHISRYVNLSRDLREWQDNAKNSL